MYEVDFDRSGEIDFDEFVAVMSRKVSATYTAEQVRGAFRVFESGAPPGHIKVESLVRALTTDGSDKLSEEQARDLVAQLEPDRDGLVNYREYVNMMMSDS
mgnify:FL=1